MAIIKHRKVVFEHYNDFSKAEIYMDALLSHPGVLQVSVDAVNGTLEISYNLELVNLKQIEELLAQKGLKLPNTFWARTKRNWIHYTEENELENAHAPDAPCCSHPDEMLAKSKRSVSHS